MTSGKEPNCAYSTAHTHTHTELLFCRQHLSSFFPQLSAMMMVKEVGSLPLQPLMYVDVYSFFNYAMYVCS